MVPLSATAREGIPRCESDPRGKVQRILHPRRPANLLVSECNTRASQGTEPIQFRPHSRRSTQGLKFTAKHMHLPYKFM